MFMLFKAPGFLTNYAILAHQSSHPVLAANNSLPSKGCMHTQVAIGLITLIMDALNFNEKRFVFQLSGTLLPLNPGIIASRCHTKFCTERGNKASSSVLMDKAEGIYFFPGKILSAFLRMAFSSRTRFNSFSNALIFFLASESSDIERAS